MSRVCASCGQPLEGRYCSSCGEQAVDPSKLTVWHFLTHTVVHELFNADGKIWRTLGLLLFRAGFLGPFRNSRRHVRGAIRCPRECVERDPRQIQSIAQWVCDAAVIHDRVVRCADALRFFHRRRPLLVEHMVFSMHYYSFVLSSLILVLLAARLGLTSGYGTVAALLLVNLWQLAHLAIAIRRFYFSTGSNRLLAWTASAIVAPVVYLLNPLYLTAIQFVGGAYAIWRL
jgi:hypothetical protein